MECSEFLEKEWEEVFFLIYICICVYVDPSLGVGEEN